MEQLTEQYDVNEMAAQIAAEIRALPVKNTSAIRGVRREFSKRLRQSEPDYIFALAKVLLDMPDMRWFVYELMRYHKATFQRIGPTELKSYGQGINSWNTVDSFARILSGPAWLKGQVPDSLIHEWAQSEDYWWRRAALVSTVALNTRSQGGHGDTARTLAVCRLLVNDHEEMVDKAMSWALRELVVHDPDALNAFLEEHEMELSARVKREVRNKLTTGLKNPGKKIDHS